MNLVSNRTYPTQKMNGLDVSTIILYLYYEWNDPSDIILVLERLKGHPIFLRNKANLSS